MLELRYPPDADDKKQHTERNRMPDYTTNDTGHKDRPTQGSFPKFTHNCTILGTKLQHFLHICKKMCNFAAFFNQIMENNTIEMALLEPEERELVEYIYNAIPAEDRGTLTADDILFVLDAMDDYLEEKGLLRIDEATEEMEYLDGEVDETEQLNYVLEAAKEDKRAISSVQIQLIQDAELQYGIEKGYYEEE